MRMMRCRSIWGFNGRRTQCKQARRKQFFFAKKNQKTLIHKGLSWPSHVPEFAKVFASFFKKKRFLPYFLNAHTKSMDLLARRC
jgi:hypothetical protein